MISKHCESGGIRFIDVAPGTAYESQKQVHFDGETGDQVDTTDEEAMSTVARSTGTTTPASINTNIARIVPIY